MQLFGPSGIRAFPTDRGPTTVANGAAIGTLGGGLGSTVATYTVPLARRAIVVAHGFFVVSTALAVGQAADIQVRVTPSGGGIQTTAFDRRIGSALDQRAAVAVELIQLRPGDLVEVRAELTAGVGVITTTGGIQGVEYDV